MAKKKSKSIKISTILRVVGLVLGLGAVLFALLNCVKYTDKILETETFLTGFEVIFGSSEKVLTKEVVYTSFSFMNLIAFILPLAGGILLLFKNKLLNFISLACFVVGAVLLFLVPSFVVTEFFIAKLYTSSLAVGAILAAITSILGAMVAGYVTLKG